MPKVKKEKAKLVEEIDREFGDGAIEILKDKINEIIRLINN